MLGLEKSPQAFSKHRLVTGETPLVPSDDAAPSMVNPGGGSVEIGQARHNAAGNPHVVDLAEVVQ